MVALVLLRVLCNGAYFMAYSLEGAQYNANQAIMHAAIWAIIPVNVFLIILLNLQHKNKSF